MKATTIFIAVACSLGFACGSQGGGSPDAPTTHDATTSHDAPTSHDAANQQDSCASDNCVCPMMTACEHACSLGGLPCEVQCAPGESCAVTCDAGEYCHVEAASTAMTTVDCAGSPECHVTCPSTNCTVHNCVGAACVVSCGLAGQATRTGTTATCP